MVRRLLAWEGVKRARTYVPSWALQFAVGAVLVLLAVMLVGGLAGAAMRGPTAFFDDLGRTVSRLAPQPRPDLRNDADLRAVIAAVPDGRLRVATVLAEEDRVVFTVTASRAAVHAAVQPGDELRIGRDGQVEIAPTGIPGVLDGLRRSIDDLRRRYFGG